MIQAVKMSLNSEGLERFRDGTKQEVLSDLVIPAVRGEYYVYSSMFTEERPLYALMKCKANKDRPVAAAGDLGREANLLFLFGSQDQIQVCAVSTAHALGLLSASIDSSSFGETWIGHAKITAENFYELRSQKDITALAEICQAVCLKHEMPVALEQGTVIAMMTGGGKYGLFFVKEITQKSIWIDACHILL